MSKIKKIAVLGSTGSIGTQALDIIRNNRDKYEVTVLSCASSIELLKEQIEVFKPEAVVTKYEKDALELSRLYKGTEFSWGEQGLIEGAKLSSNDLVLNSLVGMQGLVPTYEAIKAKKDIALANKETLVAGGNIVMSTAAEMGVSILPVDSEHSAVFQSLQGNEHNKIKRVILTASGGPFRGYTEEMLKNVTVQDALKHPNWSMGSKITIDSATMINKGLEVIEAHHLFGMPGDKIDVVVHPQSIIHSMVEYEDRAVMAQLGLPDMRVPIAYAFSYPERLELKEESLDLTKLGSLTFEKPDLKVFKGLRLAYEALAAGGGAACAYNGANEELVAMFLNGKIGFTDIPNNVERIMEEYVSVSIKNIDDILGLDAEIRRKVKSIC
ncbi:MAG: 1-deoxy-D-xylulose-5-phosphate reductoisomerase [Clostridiales bacterium]|nr:1-deoxy-D-xylulose-5-phosphate reductoisomerase [Clostridiales bacterium]